MNVSDKLPLPGRTSLRRTWLLGLVGGLGLVACGDTTTSAISQLNLDRPVDITFACYGGLRLTGGADATLEQEVTVTAQPLEACTIRSGPRESGAPLPQPAGQENLTTMGGVPIPGSAWYGFILQGGPGTVAIAQFATKPASGFAGGDVNVLDANPLTPGKNGISVGEDPIAIATDKVGCFAVVANGGSCDLSGLDINTALDADPDVEVQRIAIKNAAGEVLLARPAAMAAEPAGGVIGESCPATPTGLVYLAFPACHLVAAVDSATGTIVAGIDYSSGTPTLTDGNVSCPAECGGGGTPTAGPRPVTLDLEYDARYDLRRLVIGADNLAAVTVVELGADSLPLSARQVALENTTGSLGITHIALAPQIGMGGNLGIVNDDIASGGQFQFAYAITTDDTIRVADVLLLNRECDTQVDPRLINDVTDVSDLSCWPVAGASTPARRAGARGPGIELPGRNIPTSLELFRSLEIANDTRSTSPLKLVGYFGVVSSTSGATYVVNVDDDDYGDYENPSSPLEIDMPLAIAHQLRDAVPLRGLLANSEDEEGVVTRICETTGPDPDSDAGNFGGPRATAVPTRNIPGTSIAPEKAGTLPSIRQVLCEGSDSSRPVSELGFAAPDAIRDAAFPDLRAIRDETWTLTWEGSVSNDTGATDVDGPAVRVGQMVVDGGGMRIVDQTSPFCAAGVEQFDIVQMRGCDASFGDAQCPLGYTCYVHPETQIAGFGACMLDDEASRLADACKAFLTSTRRYTVQRAASGELRLLARKSVLRTTPLTGCTDDTQCEALGDVAAELASAAQPIDDTTPEDPRTYRCEADPDRAPLTAAGNTGKRCVEVCEASSDCSTGRVCQDGYCMEGVTPPQACVNAPQRFELRVHDAFAAVGSRTGFIHDTIRDATTGTCQRDPAAHPYDTGRISLSPPACDPAADPRTGRLPDGSYEPNPCALTVDQTEFAPVYADDACTLADPSTAMVTRAAPAVRYRNRGLTATLVDPTYPGDASCIRDREGTLGAIPLVFPGFQLTWRQTGGFVPVTLPLSPAPAFPVKVVRGPTDSVWVVDEGDYLSTSASLASTRGRVYRIEIQAPTLINVLE